MELTGVEIFAGGRWKFVGKVGTCPPTPHLGILAGQPILYREVPWQECYSHKTNAVGVDVEAWDWAESMGARAMVIYCKDREMLVVVHRARMSRAARVDLGERPQYRLPIPSCVLISHAKPLPMGYTTLVHRIETPPPVTEEAIQGQEALDLFAA